MDIRKMTYAVAAVVVFSAGGAKAMQVETYDSNGNRIANPPAREDGEVGEKAEGFKFPLKSKAKKYLMGENVTLSLKFTNIDREDAAVSPLSSAEYKLEIVRPDGTLAPLTLVGVKTKDPVIRFSGGSSGPQSPGTLSEAGLYPNLYFDMTQIGEYQVRALKEVPSRADPSKKVTLVSNVLKLRIEAPKAKDAAMTTTATQDDDAEATDDTTEAATDEAAAP